MPRKSRHAARDDSGAQTPRGIWSGSISFGLVTVPVELHSAIRRERPGLRMLSADGVPLAREYVCPEDGSVLSQDEIERGFEIREGEFVTVSDEELEQLAPRRSRDIELTRFVDRDSLDPAHFERAYFLIPGAEQTKAYRLLAETMEATNRAAIAHFVMRGKAYAVAILADRGVLRAETLRFGDEIRSAADLQLPEPSKSDRKRVQQLRQIVKRLSKNDLDERELRDDETERLISLARAKQKRGKDLVEAPEAPAEPETEVGDVVDIMALIKQRMRQGAAGNRKAPAKRKKKASRSRAPVKRGARRAAARRV